MYIICWTHFYLFLIRFIGVTLVNKITYVSSVLGYSQRVHCSLKGWWSEPTLDVLFPPLKRYFPNCQKAKLGGLIFNSGCLIVCVLCLF